MISAVSRQAEGRREASSRPQRTPGRKSAWSPVRNRGCSRRDLALPNAAHAPSLRRGAGDQSPIARQGFGGRRGVQRGSWGYQVLFPWGGWRSKPLPRALSESCFRATPNLRSVLGSSQSAMASSISLRRPLRRLSLKASIAALAPVDFALGDHASRAVGPLVAEGVRHAVGDLLQGRGAQAADLLAGHFVRPHQVGRCPVRENQHTGIPRKVNTYLRTLSRKNGELYI